MSVEMRKIQNGNYAVNITAEEMIPVEVQGRYATTVQTHNAVSVVAGGYSLGTFIDALGYDKVSATLVNDSATNSRLKIHWSNDGINVHAQQDVVTISNTTPSQKGAEVPMLARYFRIELRNDDTVAHTMSAWAYLKS